MLFIPQCHKTETSQDSTKSPPPLPTNSSLSKRKSSLPKLSAGNSSQAKQGSILSLANDYEDLFKRLELGEEDRAYFLSLLEERSLRKRQLEFRWKEASEEKRPQVIDLLASDQEQSNKLISSFLKDEGNFQFFLQYESQLPEKKQLAPVLDALSLSSEQEFKLLDLIHSARLATGGGSGVEFSDWQHLIEHREAETLHIKRELADKLIKIHLAELITPAKAEQFLSYWNDLRENQEKEIAFTLEQLKSGE